MRELIGSHIFKHTSRTRLVMLVKRLRMNRVELERGFLETGVDTALD